MFAFAHLSLLDILSRRVPNAHINYLMLKYSVNDVWMLDAFFHLFMDLISKISHLLFKGFKLKKFNVYFILFNSRTSMPNLCSVSREVGSVIFFTLVYAFHS